MGGEVGDNELLPCLKAMQVFVNPVTMSGLKKNLLGTIHAKG